MASTEILWTLLGNLEYIFVTQSFYEIHQITAVAIVRSERWKSWQNIEVQNERLPVLSFINWLLFLVTLKPIFE